MKSLKKVNHTIVDIKLQIAEEKCNPDKKKANAKIKKLLCKLDLLKWVNLNLENNIQEDYFINTLNFLQDRIILIERHYKPDFHIINMLSKPAQRKHKLAFYKQYNYNKLQKQIENITYILDEKKY